MVMGLNSLGTHCAVLGNHEFDFGLQNLEQLIKISNFPWLLSNITEAESGLSLAGSKPHHILERNGIKIGVIGLVEDWLYQQQAVRKLRYQYRDYVEVGKSLAEELKTRGCDIVIALTHMAWSEDVRLAESVPEIDLVLGGHDHQYGVQVVNGKTIVKSGTEFRYLSVVTLGLLDGKPVTVNVEKDDITTAVEESKDVDLGIDGGKCGLFWMTPMYLWWAVKYHGYKRVVKLRRALSYK